MGCGGGGRYTLKPTRTWLSMGFLGPSSGRKAFYEDGFMVVERIRFCFQPQSAHNYKSPKTLTSHDFGGQKKSSRFKTQPSALNAEKPRSYAVQMKSNPATTQRCESSEALLIWGFGVVGFWVLGFGVLSLLAYRVLFVQG